MSTRYLNLNAIYYFVLSSLAFYIKPKIETFFHSANKRTNISCQPLKMALLFIIFLVVSVSSLCVKESSTHLYCTNELYFDGVYGKIEKLSISRSFINKKIIRSTFTYLKEIEIIQSSYLLKQCEILYEFEILITGCESGVWENFLLIFYCPFPSQCKII